MSDEYYCSKCNLEIEFEEESIKSHRRKDIIIISISGLFLVLSVLFDILFTDFKFFFDNKVYSQIFAAIVVIISGHEIIIEGIIKLTKKTISINILMTIAAIGSFFIGHGGEGAAVMFLFYIVEFLEDFAIDRSKKSITELIKIAPNVAMVKRGKDFRQVHTHDVLKGEIFQLKPGDSIPLDGVIIKGSSNINEASLTGESIPVYKEKGNEVYAGTINLDGYLEVEVTKTSDETLLAKIQRVIIDAKNKKSKIENFVDRFAKYYTPIMILAAMAVIIFLPLLFSFSIYEAIYRALTFLVISCPCALALSTPISIIAALTSGAKHGILIKGGKYVEELNKVQTIAFDKTGTLTEGILKVVDIISYNGEFEDWFGIAAGLENFSEHPISKAILEEAENRNIKICQIEDFKALSGKGVIGKFKGETYLLGNKALFREYGIKIPEEEMHKLEKEGKTVILFGKNSKLIGLITLRDKIRNESKSVINELKKKQIHTIIISGDNKNTVRAIQNDLGVDEIYYELNPSEKQRIVQNYAETNKGVAMVGDGVNDAPALAVSNVGIAMGGIGSDVSLETADVILMNDNLSEILSLLKIARKTSNIIKQNIYFAIIVKLLFVVLTLFGLMSLWIALGIGDLGVTFIVILNSFRISFTRKKERTDSKYNAIK